MTMLDVLLGLDVFFCQLTCACPAPEACTALTVTATWTNGDKCGTEKP